MAGMITRRRCCWYFVVPPMQDLCAHFDEIGLQPPMYLIDWVFTCYCKVLGPDMSVWVWDRFILSSHSDLYLIKAGLGL